MIICIELNVEAFNPYIAPLRHIVNLHLITKIQISMGSQVMLCADQGEGCSPQKEKKMLKQWLQNHSAYFFPNCMLNLE